MKLIAGTLLQEARSKGGLSQQELANRCGVSKSQVTRIELHQIQPSLPTLFRLLAAANQDLEIRAVTKDGKLTASQIAEQVFKELASGDEERAFRTCIALMDELSTVTPARLSELVDEVPVRCSDDRYNALIASIVEHFCSLAKIEVPLWTNDPKRFCSPWYASDIAGLESIAVHETPPAFARHGISILASELSRV